MTTNSISSVSTRKFLFLLVATALILLLVGLLWLSKARQKGENYISLRAKAEAQITGKDPCDILAVWLAAAKLSESKAEARMIQQAQKFLGCRNVLKRLQGGVQMNWYAAHAVMYIKFKDRQQEKYPLWENILLIAAESDEEAQAKAVARAKEDEGDSEGTFTWEGLPATWCFGGIRKLVTCESEDGRPTEGTEITYLEMEANNQADFERFMAGEPVTMKYGG